ncbi:MAG: hypothetical protein AB7F41_08630 [Methylocystis sp.]|uniref:hypothetical protein n=1 Tax=Methylocystis sp. TaxID=1911079 RepID=UPI003D10F970
MKRFVLLFNADAPPAADLGRIAATSGVRVVDHEIARAALVEADDVAIEKLRKQLPDWIISPETSFPKREPQ